MRAGAVGAAAFCLGFLLLAAVPGHAQTAPPLAAPLPPPGFVPPYEVGRIVRSAGFNAMAPPRREGATYVVRATDFRGILMRVVIDARSGAIRAVNRIVPGPEPYGPIGMLPSPYEELPPSAYMAPRAYGPPPAYASPQAYAPAPVYPPPAAPVPEAMPPEESAAVPLPPSSPPQLPLPPLPVIHAASHPLLSGPPPLPRPRPAELAARKGVDEDRPGVTPAAAPPPSAAGPEMPKHPPATIALPD